MICGHGQHGKDTFADYLVEATDGLFSKWSSSQCAQEEALVPNLDKYFGKPKADHYRYVEQTLGTQAMLDEMYGERGDYRDAWKRAIKEYNSPDLTRLMRKLYEKCNIYVGIRDRDEFNAGKQENAFDFSIWVEDPSKPPEPSNDIRKEDCLFTVMNDTHKGALWERAQLFAGFLNPEYRRPKSGV